MTTADLATLEETVNAPTTLASVVDGNRREGEEAVDDINPAAPDQYIATVSLAGPQIAADAVDAAARASESWRHTPPPNRGEILRRASDLLENRAEAIGRDLAREEGKT